MQKVTASICKSSLSWEAGRAQYKEAQTTLGFEPPGILICLRRARAAAIRGD